jgi:hypothetical protein
MASGGGHGDDPGGLMWVGLAAGEPGRRSRSSSRTRADAPPLSPRAGMGPPPTLREQMSAAAAAAAASGDAPLPPSPGDAGASSAPATDPELVSLALRVRQHSGAPYDARAPRAPQPQPQAGGPPAWCAMILRPRRHAVNCRRVPQRAAARRHAGCRDGPA